MDDRTVGRCFRAIRHRLDWRQADVADRAGVSQTTVSVIERGRIDRMPLAKLRAVARALDADVIVTLHWRGGELDRLRDEGHATLVGRVVELLEQLGWQTATEVTFAVYGERGSIDVLAWHEPTRTLLIVEVKTELTSVEETLRRHDVKVRLAPPVARDRFGWRALRVARLLVLPDETTSRRRVARHAAVLERAYPERGRAVRAWLHAPDGGASGLIFLPARRGTRGRRAVLPRLRVRGRASSTGRSPRGPITGDGRG